MMFEEIRKCLDEYEEVCKKYDGCYYPTEKEMCILDYFDLHLAEAIMRDFGVGGNDKGEKLAKIILATLGMSNDIKVKVE